MWKCKQCNEENEDTFDACWNCGTSIEGTAANNLQEFEEIKEQSLKELEIIEEKEARSEVDGGFFAEEKKGIQKGVLGGIGMMTIAAVLFVAFYYAAGIAFPYLIILFIIGLYAFLKGLVTGNVSGRKSAVTIRCSVFIAVSLDGFIARRSGDIDWLTNADDGSGDYGYKEFVESIDAVIMGRNTYELVLTFKKWPYAGKKVMVLSSGSPNVPASLSDGVEIVSCSPAELVNRLSKSGTRHLYVDGGKMIQCFLRAGLIQEMTITRIPILIGDGIPLFGKLDQDIKLLHLETKTYKSGFVQSKYHIISAA